MINNKDLLPEEIEALKEISKPSLQKRRISLELKASLVKKGYANDLLGGPAPSPKGRMFLKK